MIPIWMKFTISIIYDIVDFFIPLGFTQFYNIVIGVPLGFILWGPLGVANLWEAFVPFDVAGKLIPTMTSIGVIVEYPEILPFGGK